MCNGTSFFCPNANRVQSLRSVVSEEHIFITFGLLACSTLNSFELFHEKMAPAIQMAVRLFGSNGHKLRFTRGRAHILGARCCGRQQFSEEARIGEDPDLASTSFCSLSEGSPIVHKDRDIFNEKEFTTLFALWKGRFPM